MEVILNLFTKYLQVGETWNGYRAMVFRGIEDLFIGTDIEIDSNVCKIRTSSTKEKTYICTQLHQVRSHQNTRTEDPRENLICMRNCFHQQLRKSTQQCWSCGSVIPTDSSVCNKYLSNNPIIEHLIKRNRKGSTQRCESKNATIEGGIPWHRSSIKIFLPSLMVDTTWSWNHHWNKSGPLKALNLLPFPSEPLSFPKKKHTEN